MLKVTITGDTSDVVSSTTKKEKTQLRVITATTNTNKPFSLSSSTHRGVNFPRICLWESDGENGDITCDIIDCLEIYDLGFKQFKRGPSCFFGIEAKRTGVTICEGHNNYDLMLNLQLGIRYSVGKHAQILRDLKPSDFDPKEKFWTRFLAEGSKITPPHQSAGFRWKD